MSNRGTYAQVIGGLRWIALSRAAVQVSSWALTLVVIRLLTPFDYGVMSMVAIVLLFAATIIDAGMGPALIQRKDVTDAVLSSVLGLVLTIATLGFIAAQVLAPLAAKFFNQHELELLIRVASLQLFVMALTVLPRASLSRAMRFKEQALAHTGAGLTQGLVTIALALSGYAYWSLLIGAFAGRIVECTLATWYARASVLPSLNFHRLAPLFRFSRFTLGERVLWYLVQNTDSLLVGRLLGAHQLGVFSIAKELSHMPLDKIGDIASQVTVSAFSRIQDDRAAVVEGVRRVVQTGAVVGFAIFWGILAVATDLVPLVLGNAWAATTSIIIAFCAALPLRVVWVLMARTTVGMGRPDITFGNQALWLVTVLPAIVYASTISINAVAIAWSATFPVLFLLASWRMAGALALPLGLILRPLLPPAVAGGVMLLAVTLVARATDAAPVALALIAQVLCGALTYALALRVTSKSTFEETRNLALRLLGRKVQDGQPS